MTCKNMFYIDEVKEPTKTTILKKIKKTDQCWNWLGSKNIWGYGIQWYKGTGRQAHRLVWTIYNGPIPKSLFILHKCRNRACVNPSHLYMGTSKDNANDRRKDGTISINRGEKHPLSKITIRDAELIRELYSTKKYSQYRLAGKFNVSRGQILSVVSGKTWRYGKKPYDVRYPYARRRNAILSQALANNIRIDYKKNIFGRYRLAEKYGVSSSCIQRVLNGDTWRIGRKMD